MNLKVAYTIFFTLLYVNATDLKAKNESLENKPLNMKRDVFSYFWMTEEAKYKLFVQSLIEEFQRKINEEKERELEKKLEIERKIYREHLSSRVSGTILKDFLTVRY
jgi:hypothetical protein